MSQVDSELGLDWKEPLDLFSTLIGNRSKDPASDREAVEAILEELADMWEADEEDFRAKLGDFMYLEMGRKMKVLQQNLVLFADSDWSKRDGAMGENTLGIFDVMGDDAKVLLWAHNGHVFSGAMTFAGTDNPAMGGAIEEALGDAYYALGFLFNSGIFQANGYDANQRLVFKRYHLDQAPLGALASYFSRAGAQATMLDFANLPTEGPIADWLLSSHGVRRQGGYNVADDVNRTTRSLSRLMGIRPALDFDGLLYIDQTTAAVPVDKSMIDERIYGN